MSSNSQSERSMSTSSSKSGRAPARSIIISNVPITRDINWLFDSIDNVYGHVVDVFRRYDLEGNELNSIRVDFDSEDIVASILNDNEIYIAKKSYSIRPYWPLVCYRCHKEGHVVAECPKNALPQWRLTELIEEHQSNFEKLMQDFEDRWTTRLENLQVPKSESVDNAPLKPIVNELTGVWQQINHQNVQMQQKLNTIAQHLNNFQIKTNN